MGLFPLEGATKAKTAGSTAGADPQQLSIFEVDPNTVSTEPMTTQAVEAGEPVWIGSSWQQMHLHEHPQTEQLPD